MIVSAIRPPASPIRMDSVGKPGIGDGCIDVVVVVELVDLELVAVLVVRVVEVTTVVVDIEVEVTVVVTND